MVVRLSNLLKSGVNSSEMDSNSNEWLLEQHVREAEMEAANTSTEKSDSNRVTYVNQEQFDKIFSYQPAPTNKFNRHKLFRRIFRPCLSVTEFANFFYSFLPIFQWLPTYEWKQSLMGDAVAGLTVGVIHIPQGIAYAVLAGVGPIYGLYTSFFAVICYSIFGSSRTMSVGPFAVVSLMLGESVRQILQTIDDEYVQAEISYIDDQSAKGQTFDLHNFTDTIPKLKVEQSEIVQAITFTAGLIQLLLGILRVEFLASYLSDQLVNGFCTGAALHVIVVQLNKLVEISVKRYSGRGYVLKHLMEMFRRLSETNVTALSISTVSFIFLYIGKEKVNPIARRFLPAPIPFELLLIIVATAVSFFFSLHEVGQIAIANEIPVGLPSVQLPRFDLIQYVIGDALEISFVVLALHLSMCRIFNRITGNKTDNNQELYAFGLMGTISSFFGTYPVTSALGRTMLSVDCGVQTQLSAIFTASLLLIVILFCGPLLRCLPTCVLAVVIIYSIKNIFRKAPAELSHLFKVSKIDFIIWIFAFCSTVYMGVMQGLAISVVFALLTTVFRIQWPKWQILSRLSGTQEYRDSGRYSRVTHVNGVRVFRFDAPLLFTNVEHFNQSVEQAVCRADAIQTTNEMKKNTSIPGLGSFRKLPIKPTNARHSTTDTAITMLPTVQHLVIDCSGFTFIDYTSISSLVDIYHQLKDRGIRAYFAGAKAPVRDTLVASGFFEKVPLENFYPTIHDAVNAAISTNQIEDEANKSAENTTMKSLKSLNHASTASIQPSLANESIGISIGELRKTRSPTQWSLSINRDRRSETITEWGARLRPSELDDV
ncbi:STAS domain-containing protein [Aphelenchoides besseyi]|nr:STAS domain-containing protein [Aphelenchoides besseyi]